MGYARLTKLEYATGVQRLFGAFPDGKAGLGLLLIRMVLVASLTDRLVRARLASPWVLWASVLTVTLLLVGLFTPVVAFASASIGIIAFANSSGPDRIAVAKLVITFAALGLLGPGACSWDARLFGRRRLISGRSRLPSARESV